MEIQGKEYYGIITEGEPPNVSQYLKKRWDLPLREWIKMALSFYIMFFSSCETDCPREFVFRFSLLNPSHHRFQTEYSVKAGKFKKKKKLIAKYPNYCSFLFQERSEEHAARGGPWEGRSKYSNEEDIDWGDAERVREEGAEIREQKEDIETQQWERGRGRVGQRTRQEDTLEGVRWQVENSHKFKTHSSNCLKLLVLYQVIL